jgi:hypothetical protein
MPMLPSSSVCPSPGAARDGLGADMSAGAEAVVHHHRLAPAHGQRLRGDAREHVGGAAGGEGHDDAHLPRRSFAPAPRSGAGMTRPNKPIQPTARMLMLRSRFRWRIAACAFFESKMPKRFR